MERTADTINGIKYDSEMNRDQVWKSVQKLCIFAYLQIIQTSTEHSCVSLFWNLGSNYTGQVEPDNEIMNSEALYCITPTMFVLLYCTVLYFLLLLLLFVCPFFMYVKRNTDTQFVFTGLHCYSEGTLFALLLSSCFLLLLSV